jgi:hypothetical protein
MPSVAGEDTGDELVNKALLGFLGMVLGYAASQGTQQLMFSIETSKEKRFGADLRSVMQELEDYRTAHMNYPVACGAQALSDQIGPRNLVSSFGVPWFQYCSDGQQYLLAFVPFGTTAYSTAYGAPLLATNDDLLAAPASVPRGGHETTGNK